MWPPAAPAVRAALLCDFDGTLAPIVDDPGAAEPLPAARRALFDLAGRLGLVAVVTGRSVADVRRHLTDRRIAVVGQYGLEQEVDGAVVVDPRVASLAPAVGAAADEAAQRWPGLRVERKGGVACTLHWRERPAAEPAAAAVVDLADRYGLVAWPARMAVELRPPVAVDKGTAVIRLLAAGSVDLAVFAGDDHGDLAAMAAVRDWAASAPGRRSVGVAVASPESPPALVDSADLVVDGPAGFADRLVAWAAALA